MGNNMKQAVGITLPSTEIGLELYGLLVDGNGVTVSDAILESFVEFGKGYYTFVYSSFPDNFYGTLAVYEVGTNRFVGATEINPTPITALVFNNFAGGNRQRDIYIYRGETTNLTWLRNNRDEPTEVVFTIKHDMTDSVDDAMLVVSLTNGCERINGEPAQDASLATIQTDVNFIYVFMNSELTDMFDNHNGTQQYDIIQSTTQGNSIAGYGDCNVVLGGTI